MAREKVSHPPSHRHARACGTLLVCVGGRDGMLKAPLGYALKISSWIGTKAGVLFWHAQKAGKSPTSFFLYTASGNFRISS